MNIKLNKKFTDKELDEFIDRIYLNFTQSPNDKYYFDLSEVEFIGNQELLVLSALFQSFVKSNIEFEVAFFKKGVSTSQIDKRVKRQIIQFWEVWKIWQVVPNQSYDKYFGIDGNSVQRLQQEINYFPRLSEIYTRHGITPFVSLDYINNYDEVEVQKRIKPIYKLNDVVEGLLRTNKCYHPFTSNSLSTIITEELYLNFLDHSIESSFKGFSQQAFMSISVQSKLDEERITKEEIQKQKSLNFKTECLEEAKGFFYDSKNSRFKNLPYIQFSFLDFGKGIADTLKEQFRSANTKTNEENLDSEILRFAFNHDSSRHPIFHEKNKLEQFIPRGLFDALTIVRRYKGLLVIRSNHGKILFDFSLTNDVNKAFSYFGNRDHFFPGTLISLYIPAIEDSSKLNVSSIKPEVEFARVKPTNEKYININSIANSLTTEKEFLYSSLLSELKKKICVDSEHSLVYVSFRGCELPKRIIKKTIYFLLSDYDINHKNNVVILHSPPNNIVGEIASEILMLNDAIKNYKLHPLPIIDFNKSNDEVNVTWLGIYNDADKDKLKDLLFEQYSLAKLDFQDPANISGHLNEFDSYGNLISNFPSKEKINNYRQEDKISISIQIEELLKIHDCIKVDDGKSLYICNGNYYQREYVELNNLINDKSSCNTVTKILFDKILEVVDNINDYKFIGVTTSSHKILKSFETQGLIAKGSYFSLDSYLNFENELNNEEVKKGEKFILICDVFSTGFLTKRLQTKINELGATIEFIGVIVSISDSVSPSTVDYSKEFKGKLIYLHKKKIQKFKRKDISQEVIDKSIIRVNPYTNIPIRLSIEVTNYRESILFPSEISFVPTTNEILIFNRFLEKIHPKTINIGFLKFNNVIHPYFFDTDKILKEIDKDFLVEIFERIKKPELKTENIKLFYPRKSGIENFNFDLLKDVLQNDSIEEIEIERFGTPEGWRFPHNTDYLSAKIKNSFCFILDDGSCSGDSLVQMIDEISFYEAKEIILLCFIGRVNDHKREFFSRVSNIKVASEIISISIFFVCHWHIPTYYLDENPNIRETAWLKSIVNIQNTPQNIREIARTIINVIQPRKRETFEDYLHLPKTKISKELPKHELLLVREELGKVIGYRLYKESFAFFDYLIKKYEKRASKKDNAKDRYKEIELLCGCFVYEPYLYEKIQGILPDVVEKIEDFVDVLIFNHEEIAPHLTYDWDKKDIIHLFFVIFKNEKLIEQLTKEKFIALARFTRPKESALDYVLYKLLNYFPILNSDINKYSSQIKKLLLDISDLEELSATAKTKIKIYRWFITSLPSSNTLSDFQSKLKANFEKIVDQKFHDDNIFNDKQIINSVLLDISNKIRKGETYENEILIIKNHWRNIATFITDLLSFSRSFPKFFIDERLLIAIESKEDSLRTIYGELTETIYDKVFRAQQVGERLDEIFVQFILDESQPLKVFSKPKTSATLSTINNFFQKVTEKYSLAKLSNSLTENVALDFPQYFFETLLKEIYTNLRHINTGNELKINVSKTKNNYLKIKVWNFLNEDEMVRGGNNGMKILKNLNNPYHNTYYKRYSRKLNYLQIIKIKIL